jgi:predicted AAA+ superfamily ATPase
MLLPGIHTKLSETETVFLWGPRQTGKTTLLQAAYPNAFWIDLLKEICQSPSLPDDFIVKCHGK